MKKMKKTKWMILLAMMVAPQAYAASGYLMIHTLQGVASGYTGMVLGGGQGVTMQLTSQDTICNRTWYLKPTLVTKSQGVTRLPGTWTSWNASPATKFDLGSREENFGTPYICNAGSADEFYVYNVTY